jgi:hypothetical protein
MADKVKVKIKELHNIGGVGKAGDVVWMTVAEAEAYFRDGYVEYVEEQRSAISGELLAEGASTASGVPLSAQREEVVEDHAIMKPQAKRTGRVARKK